MLRIFQPWSPGLGHRQVSIYQSWIETVYDSSYLANLNQFFRVLDFHVWIVQVEDQGQTRYTRILDWKLLIDSLVAFNIDWSWNFFSLHISSTMLNKQVINFRNVRWWELEIKDRSSTQLNHFTVILYSMGLNSNIFSLHMFRSVLIKQVIDLKYVKTGNLNFMTDCWDEVMDGCTVLQ